MTQGQTLGLGTRWKALGLQGLEMRVKALGLETRLKALEAQGLEGLEAPALQK